MTPIIIPHKKLKNGFAIPVLGFGTWKIGGGHEKDIQNDAQDILSVQHALQSGITHIDMAEVYGQGHTEELVGEAIKEFDRSKLFLASKVWTNHFSYNLLIQAAKDSIKRLQTDYIDLYMLHRPNLEGSIEETMKAMDFLVDKGFIKYIGVSNFTATRFKEAQSYTKNKIVVNQVHYNLKVREVEQKGLLKYCQENDVMLVAWRPLQKSIFSQSAPVLEELCTKYQKTPSQIALNWLISQNNVVTISKMGNPEHLEENLQAVRWNMEKEDIEKLRNEFPNQLIESDSVPLI